MGDPGHRAVHGRVAEPLDRSGQGPHVGHGVGDQPEAAAAGPDHADRGAQPGLGRGQAEAAAQVEHGHHAAAQVEQAEHGRRGVGQRGQGRHPHHLHDAAERQRVLVTLHVKQDHAGRVGRLQMHRPSLTAAGLWRVSTGRGARLTAGLHPGRTPCRSR
jgi:hypothetical protein